jgi:hypothetical protein
MRIPLSWLIGLVLVGTCYVPDHVSAGRIIFNPQQKSQLQQVKTIFIKALTLTEKGLVDPTVIEKSVSDRLTATGFTVMATESEPHDVMLKVKCDERKPWGGVRKSDGEIQQPGAPSRNWKGPACQLSYVFDGRKGPWQYEVRTTFDNAWKAARANGHSDPGQFALRHLGQALRESDFPLDLAAEWKQARLLSSLLTDPKTDKAVKLKILSLAGHMPGDTMLQALQRIRAQADFATPATVALGFMGEPAIPTLMDLLSDPSSSVDIQAAAAEALGEIGAHSGNVHIVPPLLAKMQAPDVHLRVQTEVVRAIGKTPDLRSVEPLEQLGLKAWTARSNDPLMQELREAVDWSLWQINPSAHTDE